MKIGPTDANNRSKVDAKKSPSVKRLYSKCEINNIDKKVIDKPGVKNDRISVENTQNISPVLENPRNVAYFNENRVIKIAQ